VFSFVSRWVGKLTGIARSIARVGATTSGASILGSVFAPAGHGAGTSTTSDRRQESLAYRTWVYIAIGAIGDEVAKHKPVCAFRRPRGSPGGPHHKNARYCGYFKALTDQPTAEGPDALEVMPDDHPLPRLLANPNGPDTARTFWKEHELMMGLHGLVYWWVIKNEFGVPCELWIIPTSWVTPFYGTGDYWISHLEVRPHGAARPFIIAGEDVIVFREPHPFDKRDGYGPLAAGGVWVDSANSIDRTRLNAMKFGAAPTLGLVLGERYADPDDVTLDRIYAKFLARSAGEHNVGRPVIVPPGTDLKQLTGANPAEMQFNESGNTIRDNVLALYKVPYTKAMIVGGATFENYRESNDAFYENTIDNRLGWYGQVITEKLARPYWGAEAVVFWRSSKPVDAEQLNADIATDAAAGAITPDEIRQKRGKEPLPGGLGSKPLVAASMQTLEAAHAPPAPDAGLPPDEDEDADADAVAAERSGDERGGERRRTGVRPIAGPKKLPQAGFHQPALPAKSLPWWHVRQYREEDHPRGDDGKWTSGGSGSARQPKARPRARPSKKLRDMAAAPDPAKVAAAKKNHKLVDRDIQRYAEERNEPLFARMVGGASLPDNEPFDTVIPHDRNAAARWRREVERRYAAISEARDRGNKVPKFGRMDLDADVAHCVELKTMVDNDNVKITCKTDAQARKIKYAVEQGAKLHTVVLDDHNVYDPAGDDHDDSRRVFYYRRGVGSFRVETMHKCKNLAELKRLMNAPESELPDAARMHPPQLRAVTALAKRKGLKGYEP